MAATSPQIIDQLLADRRARRWPRSPKFNLRKRAIVLPGVELPGKGVEARMAGRLDVPNDRQYVGSELRRLRVRTRFSGILFGALCALDIDLVEVMAHPFGRLRLLR
jgi:hypothetical protein